MPNPIYSQLQIKSFLINNLWLKHKKNFTTFNEQQLKNTVTHKKSDFENFGQMTQAKPQPPGKTCSRERILFSAIKLKYTKNMDKFISATVLNKLTEFINFTIKFFAN